MKNGRALKERRRSNGCPRYPRGDLDITFLGMRSDLRKVTVTALNLRQCTEKSYPRQTGRWIGVCANDHGVVSTVVRIRGPFVRRAIHFDRLAHCE